MAIERAVNFPFRVQGLDTVRNAFRSAGQEGTKSFSEIKKAANGAAQEVTDFTARMKRAAAAAKADFANDQLLNKGPADQVKANYQEFVLTRLAIERDRIAQGLPEIDAGARAAGEGFGFFRNKALLAAAATTALSYAIKEGLQFAYEAAQAYSEHERVLDQFNATLRLTGNQSNATARDIRAMAEAVTDSTLQSEQSTLTAAASLARVPGITREILAEALAASAKLADATGQDIKTVADTTRTVFTQLAERDMKGLIASLKDVNDPLKALIYRLAEAGKTAEAQQAYVDGLRRAAGNGPDGLAKATDEASKAWKAFKEQVGSFTAPPATAALNSMTAALKAIQDNAATATKTVFALLNLPFGNLAPSALLLGGKPKPAQYDPVDNVALGGLDGVARLLGTKTPAQQARSEIRVFETKYGSSGGGGSRRRSAAKDNSETEAKRAQDAADSIVASNQDAIDSYALRAREAQARLGLEGAALEAVVRQQTIDASARQISTDLIAKEVEAQRLATKGHFDEAAARAAASATVERQQAAIREHAAALYDAEKAQAAFNERMQIAAQIYDQTRSPLEKLTDQVREAQKALAAGDISADTFNRRMDQLAESMVRSAERGEDAWRSFGNSLGRTLSDIALRGGSAQDILQRLIELPLERLLYQNVELPLGKAFDTLTGRDHDKNVAAARAQLPVAAQGAPDLIAALGLESGKTASAMQQLVPQIGDVGSGLASLLSAVTGSAASSGAGFFSSLLGLGSSALGSVSFAGGASSAGFQTGLSVGSQFALPGFAAGGRPPLGMDFWVGENGRERMRLLPGGGALVVNGAASHRPVTQFEERSAVNITMHFPSRADPRRTSSMVARGAEWGISRARRKGLGAGPPPYSQK